MAEPLTLKDHSIESQVFIDRVMLGFGLLLLLTGVLVARMFYLQIVQHSVYATLSDKNRMHIQSLPPTRGLIFDRNNTLIADNVPARTLTIVKERVTDLEETIEKIRRIIPVTDKQVIAFRKRLERRQRPFEPVPFRFKLTEREIAKISVDSYDLPGVEVKAHLVRYYPLGSALAHALGSVRRINVEDLGRLDPVAYSGTNHVGKIGAEKYYEKLLLGEVGYQRVESNARGKIMQELDKKPPVPGMNLTLHLDARLQTAAINALAGRRGAVVAIEPSTGGILALVSNPSYDPNLFVSGIDQKSYGELAESADVPLFNRALQGQYEPGSTLKPLIALAALERNIISADYTIEDPGWFKLPDNERLYRDWNWTKTGLGGHGQVDLQKAIYRSCNVYFYELAVKIGIETLSDYFRLFGLGRNTTLDLPEARTGLIPTREWKQNVKGEAWFPGDTVNIGIGQGSILATPLQLATAVTVLANRGRWVSPRLIMNTEVLNAVASENAGLADVPQWDRRNWDTVIDAMLMVVHRGNRRIGENGTAWAYIGQDIEYQMAGKSGTAQVVEIAQGEEYVEEELDERLRKHAWFIGFAPVDEPKIALSVLLENGGGGSRYAAPVARQIFDDYLLR
jgi:penicillin-binding protein 2